MASNIPQSLCSSSTTHPNLKLTEKKDNLNQELKVRIHVQNIKIEFGSFVTPSYFVQCNILSFRRKFERCLKLVINLSASHHDSIQCPKIKYDLDVIHECLFGRKLVTDDCAILNVENDSLVRNVSGCTSCNNEISWQNLCSHHEKYILRRRSIENEQQRNDCQQPTLLGEILHIITNNKILIPDCCTPVLIEGLTKVYCELVAFDGLGKDINREQISSFCANNECTIDILQQSKSSNSLSLLFYAITKLLKFNPMAKRATLRFFQESLHNLAHESHLKQLYSNLASSVPSKKEKIDTSNRKIIRQIIRKVSRFLSDRYSFSRANGVVILFNHVVRSQGSIHVEVFESVLNILRLVDDIDVLLLRLSSILEQNRSNASICRVMLKRKSTKEASCISTDAKTSKRRQSYVKNECIHRDASGETQYCFDPSKLHNSYMTSRLNTISNLKFNQEDFSENDTVIKRNNCNLGAFLPSNNTEIPNQNINGLTMLPIDIVQLRYNLYRFVLSMARSNTGKSLYSHVSTSMILPLPYFHILRNLLFKYPTSAVTRLCSLMVADCLVYDESRTYVSYLNLIFRAIYTDALSNDWKSEQKESSCAFKVSSKCSYIEKCALKSYCEMIAECSIFDDLVKFWNVLKPIFTLALELKSRISYSGNSDKYVMLPDNDSNEKKYSSNETKIKILLRSISYLLLRRNSAVTGISIKSDLKISINVILTRCATEFSEQEWWVNDETMSTSDKEEIITVIKAIGILSFLSESSQLSCHQKCEDPIQWPYPKHLSLRKSFQRMGPKAKCFSLLLSNSTINGTKKIIINPILLKRKRSESISSDPIMSFLNEDTFRVIFSYLGYKKLVCVTTVCTHWNRIGNDNIFWNAQYKKRYKKSFFLESLVPDNFEQSIKLLFFSQQKCQTDWIWRNLFDEKWKVERSIRFKLNKEGWRYRSCHIIGCLQILRSKGQQEKHHRMHKSKVIKQLDSLAQTVALEAKGVKKNCEGVINNETNNLQGNTKCVLKPVESSSFDFVNQFSMIRDHVKKKFPEKENSKALPLDTVNIETYERVTNGTISSQNFIPPLKAISIINTKKRKLRISWSQRINELSTYLGKFGDCNVPMDYTVPGLGSWVKKQRKNKNLSTSSQLQINKILNDANKLSDQDY